jgi:hypothetical protein
MRACSYHASPGGSKASVLCISLWMICLNTLVSRCAAVDERGCGKVDNSPALLRAWQQPVVECNHFDWDLLAGTRR